MLFEEKSLFLAPMEGITDDIYRYSVEKAFGGWDFYACDFLRLPAAGRYTAKHILKHYGRRSFETPYLKEKTYYQVLASQRSDIENTIALIEEVGFDWLDLNLGCPSKTVCKNQGGSFLLSDIKLLEDVISRVRKSFKARFTAKIRLGFKDDSQFLDILKCLEDNGVEMITIHGRTREDLYKGRARWEPIAQAVEMTNIPIVGNGDVWTSDDIDNIIEQTQCHGVMLARGAMKSPWIAKEYKTKNKKPLKENINLFLKTFIEQMDLFELPESIKLKRLKSLSRYLYDDLKTVDTLKTQLLRALEFNQYCDIWSRSYEALS